jgi:acyl dehydratase
MADPRIRIGEHSGPFSGRIDADAAYAYAQATNDPNPVYETGGAVPPLYTLSLILNDYMRAQSTVVEPGAIEGVRGGVHAEYDLYLHHPLAPEAQVSWEVFAHGAQQTPAGVLVAMRIVVSDDQGPAAEHFWTTMFIGGKIPEPVGEPLADHSFPESARDHLVGTETFPTTRDQTFRYAGASTDHAIFHIDDEAARRAGFPSKFLQGNCTLAMCSGAVVKLAAGGDPSKLRRFAGRLASPVFPTHDVDVSVYDAGVVGDHHVYAFEAESQGASVIKHGRAEFAA